MRALASLAVAVVLVAGSAFAQVDEQAPAPPRRPAPQRERPRAPQQQPPPDLPLPLPQQASQPSTQQQCPPPPPQQQTQQPLPPGTISNSSICGATIVGGTISGAAIVGGTISGSAISGGTMSNSNAPAPPPAPSPPPPQPQAPNAAAPAPQQNATPPKSPPKAEGRAPKPPNRPGKKHDGSARDSDDDDEADLAARALERALVQRGALLLPEWSFEISPAVSYGHTSQDTIATVATQSGGSTTVGLRRRTHQVTGSLTARLGLPFDLQLEGSIPATAVISDVALAGAASNDSSGFGPGDPRLSLTWQMVRGGGGAAPDILIAANFKPALGSSPFDAKGGAVGLGTGYASVGGTVTAVKSADPLVLLANLSYTNNLPVTTADGRRDPGDTYGLGGGAILAVSPDTSLSFLLDCHYKSTDLLKGKGVIATDETFAVLQLGLGRVISRKVLVNVTAAMGLTADSPNFQLGLSMPVRF